MTSFVPVSPRPVVLHGILVQNGVLILLPSIFVWSVIVILPINSAINPYLYTIAAIISNRRKKVQISPTENQQDTNQEYNRRQTLYNQQTKLQIWSISEHVLVNRDQRNPEDCLLSTSESKAELMSH